MKIPMDSPRKGDENVALYKGTSGWTLRRDWGKRLEFSLTVEDVEVLKDTRKTTAGRTVGEMHKGDLRLIFRDFLEHITKNANS